MSRLCRGAAPGPIAQVPVRAADRFAPQRRKGPTPRHDDPSCSALRDERLGAARRAHACHTPWPASRRPIASSTSISRAAWYGIGL